MNMQLSPAELQELATPLLQTMTRREKLLRLASIVRAAPHGISLFHALEHQPDDVLARYHVNGSAFALAADDAVLQDAGFRPDMGGVAGSGPGAVSALGAQKFFELSKQDMHEFSCDCGGSLTNTDMADRIERIAARG